VDQSRGRIWKAQKFFDKRTAFEEGSLRKGVKEFDCISFALSEENVEWAGEEIPT
jgi:hypothetical protein